MFGLPLWFVVPCFLIVVVAALLLVWGIRLWREDRATSAAADFDDWQHAPAAYDSPGLAWGMPAPEAGGHHRGAPFERTVTGDIWDQWWEGLDGLNRECLLVTAWVGRETAAWADLVAETRELCAA